MISLLKLLGKGLLYIILLPLGIVFFAIYGIYLFLVWIVMLLRTIILFFKGKNTGLKLPEDIRAEEVLNNTRDFSEPTPQPQAVNQGVTYNINITKEALEKSQEKGSIVHSKDVDTIDYTDDREEDK